jgi:putative DNA primase/helicase
MGAKKWRDSYSHALRDALVVIVPDNDPPGQAHAALVAAALRGIAKAVWVLPLPNLPPKGDVSDWLAAGGSRGALEALAAATAAQNRAPPVSATTPTPSATASPIPLPYSDYTNAVALVRAYGQDFRYCYPWKRWLVWTGTHWAEDTSGAVMRLAKHTITHRVRREDVDDEQKLKALMAHVKTSLSTSKLKAMVESAQSEPGIAVQPADLDKNPWLLNCVNGTLDLRTGLLHPHQRTDYMTRCLEVAYDPMATCPTWDTLFVAGDGGQHHL